MEENKIIKLDKKQKLEELEEENKKLGSTLADVHRGITAFMKDENYEEYSKMEDSEKAAKFPKEFEMYNQRKEIESKIADITKKINEAVRELYKEVEDKIETLEQKIKETSEVIEDINEEIKAQNIEINNLKETEAYKNDDKETVEKVKKLEEERNKNVIFKNAMVVKLRQTREDINKLVEYKKELVEEYGKEIIPQKQVVTAEEKTQKKTEDKPGEKPQEKGKTEKLEQRIKVASEIKEDIENKIKAQNIEIAKLEESKAYKNGDEEAVEKVKKLQAAREKQVALKRLIESKLRQTRENIDKLQQTPEENLAGKPEEKPQEKPKGDSKGPKKDVAKDDNNNSKNKDANNKKKQASNNSVRYVQANPPAEEEKTMSYAEKEKKEQEEKEAKLKQEFKDLYVKSKRGSLSQTEFDRMAEIMKSAENYDKYGITTGIIFNKAKVIFKAMGKAAAIDKLTFKNASQKIDEKLKKAQKFVKQDRESLSEEEQVKWDDAKKRIAQYTALKETMSIYQNVSKSRSQNRWSWLFEEKKPELGEAQVTADAPVMLAALESDTIPPEVVAQNDAKGISEQAEETQDREVQTRRTNEMIRGD